jgi:hypothetical protein
MNNKSRYQLIILMVIQALIISCKPSSNRENPEICGLASPVLFTGDSVKFDLNDYLTDPGIIRHVEFPEGITVT